MARIAIIGPGAVGGAIAAWLADTGRHALTLCCRRPFAELSVDTPQRRLVSQPTVVTRPDEARPVDWAFVTTKAYDAAGAAAAWFGALGAATPVAILQNGIEHVARFTPYLPMERIVPVIVDLPAERTEPGIIRQRGPGRLTVTDDARGREFAALFAGTEIQVTLTSDFRSAGWRKLCLNSAGVLSALLLQPSRILRDEAVGRVALGLMRECVAVARAEGAVLDDNLPEIILENYRKAPGDSVNSLHADRVAGRPTELDARNGAIVRFGQKHGIPTPYNEMAVALLAAMTQPAPDAPR